MPELSLALPHGININNRIIVRNLVREWYMLVGRSLVIFAAARGEPCRPFPFCEGGGSEHLLLALAFLGGLADVDELGVSSMARISLKAASCCFDAVVLPSYRSRVLVVVSA